jgi:FMN-dependent oxidoreductase (nitrilotriacetate monooxygenase family)
MAENVTFTATNQMALGFFMQMTGLHHGAWRRPEASPERTTDVHYYADLVRRAEAAKLDFVFMGDSLTAFEGGPEKQDRSREALSSGEPRRVTEPLTLLSAISVLTSRIGLVCTATTTYNEPYTVARQFASFDHVSRGRSGWNVVTSSSMAEAFNYSREAHPAHGDRYARAREFMQVVFALWDSFEDGAYVYDKERGIYSDPAKVHFINHKGDHFSVRGPLNIPRSPQGRPVIVQAGSSEDGIDFAGTVADVVFTAQQTLESAQKFYAKIKAAAACKGRDPQKVKVLPGLMPIIGGSQTQAQAKLETLNGRIPAGYGLFMLSDMLGGIDLSAYDLDGPLPEDLPVPHGSVSRRDIIRDMALRENLTIRQTFQRVSGASGHRIVCGTAADVADDLERWFRSAAADGFSLMPATLPEGLDDFLREVVPLLRRRGLFREEYGGTTLREHLDLLRPTNQFSR